MKSKRYPWWKTLLWVLLGIALVLIGIVSYANRLVSAMVTKELTSPNSEMNQKISFSDIRVNLWTGSAKLDSFRLVSDTLVDASSRYDIAVDEAEVKYVNLFRMLSKKQLFINTVEINGLQAKVLLNAQKAEDYADTLGLKVYQDILKVIALLDVENVDINNASFQLSSKDSYFSIQFDSTYLYARNLRYDLRDSTFTYNDSIYELTLRNFKSVGPKGIYVFESERMFTQNEQGVESDNFRIHCTVPKQKLADINGKVPVVWSDVSLKKLRTSPFNLIRSVIEGEFKTDTIYMHANYVDLYRDDRYPPVKVARPLQALLMNLEAPLSVSRIQMDLDKFIFANIKQLGGAGVINMKDAKISIENFENKPTNVIKLRMNSKFSPYKGKMSFNLSLHMNPLCHWNANVSMKDCEMANFNSFIGPMVGINVQGHVSQMDARYAGDSLTSKGVITLCYDSIHAQVSPKSPIPFFAKHSKTITKLAKGLIPKSNPRKVGKQPKSYYVATDRDPYQPYIVHFIKPMMEGMKETFLGGFYASKQVQSWKKKKNNWYDEYKPY